MLRIFELIKIDIMEWLEKNIKDYNGNFEKKNDNIQ